METPESLNKLNFDDYTQVEKFVKSMVFAHIQHYHPNCRVPKSDVAWDCFTTLVEKDYFSCYDERITNKMYFVKTAVVRYLIDQERKSSRTLKVVSGDAPVGESSKTLFEFIDNEIATSLVRSSIGEEIVSLLKGGKCWGIERETPELGVIKISHYAVLLHYFRGYKTEEMSEFFVVSKNRINGIIREAIDMLRSMPAVQEFAVA